MKLTTWKLSIPQAQTVRAQIGTLISAGPRVEWDALHHGAREAWTRAYRNVRKGEDR